MGRMDGTGFHIPRNRRVRLRNTVDPAVYGDFACVGNEGWVEDRREDRFGLPEVLIKWDTNHWAYNGVPDCWTFEEHFELVEDNMNKQQQAQQAALEFANTMASLFTDDEPQEPQTEDLTTRILNGGSLFGGMPPQEKATDPYQEAAEAASQRLADSEGFIVIGVDRREDGMLEPFALGYSKTTKAELAVEAHMAGVNARAHQELALQSLAKLD